MDRTRTPANTRTGNVKPWKKLESILEAIKIIIALDKLRELGHSEHKHLDIE